MLKADFHIHTRYSIDCNTPLDKLIERCLERGVNCVAIADHGTAEGALKMKEMASFKVIVAEEILTPEGEIMGMFLQETINSGYSVEETLSRIKAQGGLVCIPHPFDHFRPSAMKRETLERIVGQVDILEVFNARTMPLHNRGRLKAFAGEHKLHQSAGSDAHTLAEVGNAYIEMPEFNGRDDFLQTLAEGRVCGHSTNPLRHFYSLGNRIRKRFG